MSGVLWYVLLCRTSCGLCILCGALCCLCVVCLVVSGFLWSVLLCGAFCGVCCCVGRSVVWVVVSAFGHVVSGVLWSVLLCRAFCVVVSGILRCFVGCFVLFCRASCRLCCCVGRPVSLCRAFCVVLSGVLCCGVRRPFDSLLCSCVARPEVCVVVSSVLCSVLLYQASCVLCVCIRRPVFSVAVSGVLCRCAGLLCCCVGSFVLLFFLSPGVVVSGINSKLRGHTNRLHGTLDAPESYLSGKTLSSPLVNRRSGI